MTAAAGASTDDLFRRYGPSYRWLVTLTIMIGTMSLGLASSMVNVAVPSVMGAYGVGLDQAQWMATGFLATMAVTMLACSWLIEVLGQRLTFTAIMVVFGAGSFLSATAANIDILIFGRVLQGAATGVGYPLGMFCLFTVFPPERRGTALGIHGLVSVLSPTFGPVLGGVAIDEISWRYMFFLPLPLCAPALLLGLIFLPGKKFVKPLPPFDWIGLGLAFLMLFTSNANFFLTMGGGFGITLLTAYFQHRTQFHGEALAATQTSANETTLELLDGIQRLLAASGMPDLTQATGALNYLSQMVLAQASTLAFKDTFLAIAVVSLLAVGPAWLIGRATSPPRRP